MGGATLILMSLAIVAAVGVRAHRRARVRRAARLAARLPGAAPQTPIEVGDLRELDDQLRSLRHGCGARLSRIGERSIEHGGRALRVVRLECSGCEAERLVYFTEPRLLH